MRCKYSSLAPKGSQLVLTIGCVGWDAAPPLPQMVNWISRGAEMLLCCGPHVCCVSLASCRVGPTKENPFCDWWGGFILRMLSREEGYCWVLNKRCVICKVYMGLLFLIWGRGKSTILWQAAVSQRWEQSTPYTPGTAVLSYIIFQICFCKEWACWLAGGKCIKWACLKEEGYDHNQLCKIFVLLLQLPWEQW